ncbi:unnamed protein product [Parnassius mnemosyne]|uniref:RNA-directed DNA polymerase n=1 Tax=Parnassius mnemosyne TaxID=213953 RepID=A0AAV1LIW0_9NEOP
MLEQGIIRPSESAWSSPIWIVPKKVDASGKTKWRLVVDFRKLNEKTISDKYPIPNISDVLDKLGNCQYFTTLDLASGFYQVEMNPSDIPKTAFNVEHGHFEFLRMPMGLKNSPSTFQRVMDNVLRDLQNTVCLVYLDDIIVFSTSLQEHMVNLEKVFQKLRESNFKIQMDKSEFLKLETAYLGHIISKDGIKPNPSKISAIEKYPLPKTAKEIKQFLGLIGYYRKFIPDFARITKPLTQCLKKGRKITLDTDYINCFEKCKTLLTNDPILQYPDFNKEFILTTDASNVAIGAILSQGPIGSDKPVCYASRTLNESEVNYSTIEKELLAIVWATKYFRPYLFGRTFKILTDHKPLQWVMNLKEPNSRLTRSSSMNLVLTKVEVENIKEYLQQQEIIKNYHEGKTNHRGINESFLALSKRYYWPKMREHITKYINECTICGQAKYDRKPLKPQFNIVPPATKPFEIIHMDMFTVHNEKYLTFIDVFSKYAQAYHLRDGTALSILQSLLTFCTHHGLPLSIVTDNGTEFTNQLFTETLKLLTVLTVLTIEAQEIKLEYLEDGPGLLPFRLGPTTLITHYHTFLQYVKLDDIRDKVTLLQVQLQNYKNRLDNDTNLLYELQMDYLSSKLDKVLLQLNSLEPSRTKRGLVDGLGSVIKSVTGNLDYLDAAKYNNAIKVLKDNQDRIESEFNSHISISKEWMLQHNSVISQIIENENKINSTLIQLLDRAAYKDSSLIKYAKFAQLLTILTENIDDMLNELNRIENILAFSRASSTHHSTLSVTVIKSMLVRLRQIYDKEHVLNLETREYYDIIKSGYYFTENQIVIVLKFPVISKDTFDLFRLSIVPNKNHQSIIPPYPLIATNREKFVYMETECPKLSNRYLCEKETNTQIRTQSDCIQNLIINQSISKSCKITDIALSKEAMERLDDKHYTISFPQPTKVHTVCGREDITTLQGSYLATIPINCFLRTQEFTITNINDQVEGHPLKLMKIPMDINTKGNPAVPRISLNTINLKGLHAAQDQLMMQPPLHLREMDLPTLYHTTIPFYAVLSSIAIFAIIISVRYYYKTKKQEQIQNSTQHSYEKPEESEVKKALPATFSLKVLK